MESMVERDAMRRLHQWAGKIDFIAATLFYTQPRESCSAIGLKNG